MKGERAERVRVAAETGCTEWDSIQGVCVAGGCDCLRQARVRLEAYALAINDAAVAIDRFQDIIGWQPGKSRNRLVCEIRDRVRGLKYSSVCKAEND